MTYTLVGRSDDEGCLKDGLNATDTTGAGLCKDQCCDVINTDASAKAVDVEGNPIEQPKMQCCVQDSCTISVIETETCDGK